MNPEETQPYGLGASASPKDIRTFAYKPAGVHQKGGTRYTFYDIENQKREGICTAISLTENARKALGIRWSAGFQYLMQKKFYDLNWDEGSAIINALKVAKNIGLLPQSEFDKWETEADRTLPYQQYIEKLKAVPDAEIERLKVIASQYKTKAYASVPVDRNSMAQAIDESRAGILCRFTVGSEWWSPVNGSVEPLRPPQQVISGHAITVSNYDGNSFRVANTWGSLWADKGTAYFLLRQYAPSEAWVVYYQDVPPHVNAQLIQRQTFSGKILDVVQKIISFFIK